MRFILLFLLLIPVALAQSPEFYKDIYTFGETIQLRMDFDIELVGTIQHFQIEVKNPNDQNIFTQVNIIQAEENLYFFYFDLPFDEPEGVYTFNINNVRYKEEGILKTTEVAADFFVEDVGYGVLRIFPGAVHHKESDSIFKTIRISNLGPAAITLPLVPSQSLTPSVNYLQIPGMHSKTFYVLVDPNSILTEHVEILRIGNDYLIPFYLEPPETTCTPNWHCTDWSECEGNTQERSCSDLNYCDLQCNNQPNCIESQLCTYECTPNWHCTDWSSCSPSGTQTRSCTDFNYCDLECNNQPNCIESQLCTYECTPNWHCTDWSSCSPSGTQTRSCIDTNLCNEQCLTRDPLCLEQKNCASYQSNETVQAPEEVIEGELIKEIKFFTDPNNPETMINSIVQPALSKNLELRDELYIKNTGIVTLTNITFSLSGNLDEIMRINITNKNSLSPGGTINQFMWVNENKKPKKREYSGKLKIKSTGYSTEIPILFVIEEEREIDEEEFPEETRSIFIEELEPISQLEGFPLIQEREEKEVEKEPPYKVITTILIIVIIIIIYFLLKRPEKRRISFTDYLSKIEKK